MNSEIRIVGVLVGSRQESALAVQQILSKFGGSIRTRLGLHETASGCSGCGLILLELIGDTNEMDKLELELLAIEGVDVKKMVFNT
jgi:hypothetical protein